MLVEDDAEARLLLEQFATQSPDIFWMYTADWEDLLFINGSYEEIWGQPLDELRADPTSFLDAVHPDDIDPVRADMDRLSNGESIEHEYRVNPAEDYERWVWAKSEPIYENGELTRFAGFVRDITDRRRQERKRKQQEAVLRNVHDITADTTRTFTEQVEALLELGCDALETSYGTLSEIHGDEYIFDVVHAPDDSIEPGDTVPVSATNCEIVASEQRTVVLGNIEADAPELTSKAGYTDLGIACYMGAPVIVDEEVYGTFCFYDTSPRHAFTPWEVTLVDLMSQWVSYEMTQEKTRRELERQNDQLEDFASIVSHDLRNPLNVAEGALEMARSECESEHLDEVAYGLNRMSELIEDLLTLAKVGDSMGDLETVGIQSVVEDCWAGVDTTSATLDIEGDGRIRADRNRLTQLLENLVRNAIEHGGTDVTVTVGTLEDGFYVADDGPGISTDDREAVFESGYSTAEAGTGFGLSIVREIADAHGWTITAVDPGETGGARFEITGVSVTE